MTNIQLQQYFEVLNSIANKVTGKVAYIVTKNARKISEELEEYIDIRNDMIKKYGKTDPVTKQVGISINSPEYEKFLAEMAPYDEIEQDITLLKVKPEDLFDTQLTAVDMDRLSFMIDEDDA